MAADERTKNHGLLADRLIQGLNVNGNGRRATVGFPLTEDKAGDLLHEITPRRSLDSLVLAVVVRDACIEIVEEHHRGDLLRAYNLEPRHRVLLAGPPGNGKTTLAETLAEALMVPLYVVRYEAVIGSFLGETSQRQRRNGPFNGRLFLTMTDRRALNELLGRWRKWRGDPQAPWPRGETVWRDIFPLIRDIRPWDIDDRVRETGVLEDLAERLERGMPSIPFEAELWFRRSAERRAIAEAEISRLIGVLGGQVRLRYQLPEIHYHVLLGELPADSMTRLLDYSRDVELLRCNDVWLFRPVGQCAMLLIH